MDEREYTIFGKPIERLKRPFCEKCADLRKGEEYKLCYHCYNKEHTLYFGIIRAPGIYRSDEKDGNHLSKAIRRFKYSSTQETERKRIAEEFADILCQYVSDESEIIRSIDYLTPIPMTRKKENEEGFNHAKMIADFFSRKIDIPVEYDNLIKIKETEQQTNLNQEERRENVKDAFSIKYPDRFKGKKILLIDDVATTCSTINECAKMLKGVGVLEVNGLVLARATSPAGDSNE